MLYFRGCTARNKLNEVSDSVEGTLKKLNIEYEVLDDEGCCGSFLLRTGFVDDAKEIIKKNALKFKNQKVLVSCAGCYKTLKKDYSEILRDESDEIDVVHISQFIHDLIKKDMLKNTEKDHALNVTYHDPCHLGRHSEVYDAPRNVIKEFANLCEVEHNREKSICCGSGGGVKSAYPELTEKIAKNRSEEIENTNAELLITTCPFCKLNLNENSNIEVKDLSEFILEKISEK